MAAKTGVRKVRRISLEDALAWFVEWGRRGQIDADSDRQMARFTGGRI